MICDSALVIMFNRNGFMGMFNRNGFMGLNSLSIILFFFHISD